MTLKSNEGRDALEKKPSHVPWKTIAPWLLWGSAFLVLVLKMHDITTEDLKLLIEILKQVARVSS